MSSSQYKSAIRAQPPQEQHSSSKYSEQARQLQEFFPLWKNDDLQSLLVEVSGDIELAAARISDGTVEQWGEVSHKKDKKAPTSAQPSKPSFATRGDSRGGRGGRGGSGGRGGPGRGGAATRGRSAVPRGSTNGHAPHADGAWPSSVAPVSAATPVSTDASQLGGEASVKSTESYDQQNGLTASISAWTDASSQPETSTLATSISTHSSTWGATDSFSTEVNGTAPVTNIPISKLASKTPATSKLSWAQIARPWEKPVIPQTLPPPPIHVSQPEPETDHQPEVQQDEREEPTTAEAPTWDDEPATGQATGPEAWPLTTEPTLESPKPEPPALSVAVEVKLEAADESVPEAELIPESKPEAETKSPAQVMQVISALPAQVTATPSPKFTTRPPVVSHRTGARHKVTDQPVTLPVSFGTGIEKVGMQFGSLSLGGDGMSDSASHEPEGSAPASEPAPTLQAKAQPEPAVPPPATAPAASNSLTSVFQQQQSTPPQTSTQPQAPPQTSIPHHSIPTSVSQPIQSTQTPASHAAAATSPLQQFAQQQALANNNAHQQHQSQIAQQQQQLHQQPPHLQQLPQQVQQPHATHHSYAQLGLPTHIDPSQQTQHPAPQQALQSGPHSNYFRQTETVANPPYFHTPTPPAAQSQESPYGSFGQLGAQGQHQPSSHHGSFGGSDYGYTENQRGFYETYAQQVGFGTRNPTGLDDSKGLPVGQPATSTLPPSNVQASQQHSSQTGQPQQSGGQGPQQTYPPPMPYYFPPHAYSQNQYYGTPYSSGYVPQPFVKYPTIFQPGPPGPGTANSPASKQAGGNVGVQPQTNPYNPALYQQGGYDDYQPHPHHSQHQHQHSHSLGLTQGAIGVSSGEYGKQLYGASGMQGFMGLGGQTGAGGAGPTSNTGPRGASSPEAAYKPYAAKDVSVSAGRGAPVQQGGQGQGPSQSQGQGQSGQGGPQGQSFYGNRFGNGVGGSGTGGGPQAGGHHQQGGPQGHLGYPQSGSEPNFYGYQPSLRQQQGYWQ